MPPIPVYANLPLHPDGVTPKTAAPEGEAPQNEPNPAPTRTTDAAPIPTTQYDPSAPPPPQPGARPKPPVATSTPSFADPPEPQPGAHPTVYHGHHVTEIHTTTHSIAAQLPAQLSIPAPTQNQAPTHSTQPNMPSIPYPAPLAQYSPVEQGTDGERRSLEHPPGYVQNPYAADGTANDRVRFAEADREAKEEAGILGSVRGWVGGVANAAQKVEGDAWRWAKGRSGSTGGL